MFNKLIFGLSKGMFKDLVHELITTVVNEVQADVSKQTKLSEKERTAVNMALDLVEQRAFAFVDSKLS